MKQGTTIVGDGYAVRPLGDVNGDGIDDLGLEDRSFNTDPDDYYEGRVYAAWGQVQKELNFLTAFEKGMGSQVTGHIQGQGLGTIAGVGDVNGDGLADMALNPTTSGLQVGVLFGSPAPSNLTTASLQDGLGGFTVDFSPNSCGGDRLVAMGDTNGDMNDDFLALKLGGTSLCVIYGKEDTVPVPFADISSGISGFVISALSDYTPFSSLGIDGDGQGDFDGDGFADVIVLATNAPSERQVLMLRGAAPWPLPSLNAFRDAGRLQTFTDSAVPVSVAFVPDLNGDGRAELLLGDIGKSGGMVSLIFGAPGVESLSLNTITDAHTGIRFFNSADQAIGLGADVAAHDVTGDGIVDLIIGEDRASPKGRIEAGRIYVVNGAALMALVSTW